MKEICFLTPLDARFAFRLAGVRQMVLSPGEAEAGLRQATEDPDIGLVMIDERLVAEISEETFQALERRWPGAITVLPAPEEEAAVDEYVLRLVRRAIGYQVRLNR